MATYEFLSEIGRGGFGVVYEAVREDDGWACCAKTLRPRASQREVRRFQREVRLQAKLRHPHIVPIVAVNLEDNPPWFIMPIAQENLRQYIERVGPGEERLWVFEQVARGVEHAHANGVIHRDLKPENALIFEEEEEEGPSLSAAVSDFGLGRFRDRDTTPLTPSNVPVGTVAYAAPEQWTDAKNVDERSDVYALGKILYELLTGQIPYPDSIIDLSRVPRALAYVVQKAVEPNPVDRYQTVTALLADLRYAREAALDLRTPAEAAAELVQSIIRQGTFGRASLEPLARHLLRHVDDYPLLSQVFPTLPLPVLAGLLSHHLSTFRTVFEVYDDEMSGALPFDYCDVVADFYEAIFDLTTDSRIRRRILRRLPVMGQEHNRWHVGDVFARIAAKLSDPGLVMEARDALLADPSAARWCADYLRGRSVPTTIREAAGLTA